MSGALHVTVPSGAAELAADELAASGAAGRRSLARRRRLRRVAEVAYRACLWSRVANRVLSPVAAFDAPTPDALYAGVREVDWGDHLSVDGTLAVDAVSQRSAITHTQFAALKAKDAVVDQFREREGRRPSVDVAAPDVRLNLYIDRDRATLSIDLSGDSLHRRGYRGPQGAAPLKENLAAAILLRAGWQKLAAGATAEQRRVGFVDPMCGSGTPRDRSGVDRRRRGSDRCASASASRWRVTTPRCGAGCSTRPPERRAARLENFDLRGYDRSAAAVSAARTNAAAAGVAAHVRVEQSELDALPAAPLERGLLAVNPPYGERLGALDELAPLYASLGKMLRERYAGWQAAVLTGNPPLGRELGLHAKRTHTFFNGPISAACCASTSKRTSPRSASRARCRRSTRSRRAARLGDVREPAAQEHRRRRGLGARRGRRYASPRRRRMPGTRSR